MTVSTTFTPLEESLFLTLYARALDARRDRPILGDAQAGRIVNEVGYDFGRLHPDTNLILNVALRARKLDQVAAAFRARNPDAIGLDLGAGLDTRLARLPSFPAADWYDVDLPEVAEARRRLVPGGNVIAADVRDPGWLDAIPAGRPAVIAADGLMGFLTRDELITLWKRLLDRFPSGEIIFNSYTRFAVRVARHARGTSSVAGLIRFPGMDDPREPEQWDQRLHLVREILLSREPEVAEFPRGWRWYHRLAAHSTAWSRTGTIVLHYRFDRRSETT
ncbi:class I SAM-dependent methyltransferase [Actinoplanes sp. CA-030573]|uniref:class I SAM-dependent methyltransferase n=1 Tax=Actinoplanes sp. CA-030573 TaxID=3239898 RepID=UPI003D90F523